LAAWAAAAGDLALAAQMDLHVTDFTQTRDQDARALAVLVHEKATAHAADLADYGVEPADLADLDTRIQAFADAIGAPRHAIAERKLQTEALDSLFDQMDQLLTQRLDRIVEQFKGTPFYSEYRTARTLVGP
ncbi:MAG TPA: hypothetical protein VK002_12585, partial [Rubricoccaceae bacterium]|nr:hypothetical protein [Rubricoccaceae bacterium]